MNKTITVLLAVIAALIVGTLMAQALPPDPPQVAVQPVVVSVTMHARNYDTSCACGNGAVLDSVADYRMIRVWSDGVTEWASFPAFGGWIELVP